MAVAVFLRKHGTFPTLGTRDGGRGPSSTVPRPAFYFDTGKETASETGAGRGSRGLGVASSPVLRPASCFLFKAGAGGGRAGTTLVRTNDLSSVLEACL
jgi:hypothetical protein